MPWQRVEAFATGKAHSFKIKTAGPLRWRPAGKDHELQLIVIAPLAYRLTKHSRVLYRKPAYLICTDSDLSIEETSPGVSLAMGYRGKLPRPEDSSWRRTGSGSSIHHRSKRSRLWRLPPTQCS